MIQVGGIIISKFCLHKWEVKDKQSKAYEYLQCKKCKKRVIKNNNTSGYTVHKYPNWENEDEKVAYRKLKLRPIGESDQFSESEIFESNKEKLVECFDINRFYANLILTVLKNKKIDIDIKADRVFIKYDEEWEETRRNRLMVLAYDYYRECEVDIRETKEAISHFINSHLIADFE